MDFRSQRPEREVAPRPEPAQTLPEEPQPKKETPRTVQHIGSSHHVAKEETSKNKIVVTMLIIIAVIILVISGLLLWSKNKSAASIDASKYQAIFLSNGQVYFGKLQALDNGYFKLTKVFYIQGSTDTDADAAKSKDPQQTTSSDMKLIKLGKEVHGPEDAMIINRDQVQFYENLKSDGEVAKLIDQYKQ